MSEAILSYLQVQGGIMLNKKLAFIGAGAAAEAIIAGILRAKIVASEQIIVTNRQNEDRLKELAKRYDVKYTTDASEAIQFADIILLAMKPYDLHDAIDSWKKEVRDEQMIISILAGVETAQIADLIERPVPVIRAMPNTSASIGFAATALSSGKYAGKEHLELAGALFQTVGITSVVPEKDMHTITALSGSGPAFIYYMVEAMEKAAIELGLDNQLARKFVVQTVLGAGHMLQITKEEPERLREQITSPQGTTEAGIKVLENHHFQRVVNECIKQAKERSEQLGRK